MSISGSKREKINFEVAPKYVGLVEAKVIAVNPSAEEYAEMTGNEVKEDDKRFEYLGESKEGNTYLRLDVWLEEIKTRKREDSGEDVNELFKATFFLEDKKRENKDGTKTQYINTGGVTSWADDPNKLPEWFKERDYRIAYQGEEELYNFLRMWLSNLDYRNPDTILELEWKKLMRGNVREIREQITGEWSANIVCLATINVKDTEDGIKEYQKIYTGGFLAPYTLKFFRTIDFTNPDNVERLKNKKPRDLKPFEKFILNTSHQEFGCRDFFLLKEAVVYNSDMNFAASSKVVDSTDDSY